MAVYLTRDQVESNALNNPINFLDSIKCPAGNVVHQSGTGIFILRGRSTSPCARFARYNLDFTGNIAIPTGGAITPIATGIIVNGEVWQGSRSIFTPAVVETYGAVESVATIDVPIGCCFTVSVEYISGIVGDPTAVPTPIINVIDGSLDIERLA